MNITIWTVTSDTDAGLKTTAHGAERDAYEELKTRYCNTPVEAAAFDRHIADGTFAQLMAWLARESEGSADHFSVTSHPIEVVQSPADPILDEAFREAATNEYADEGRIEIDSDAVVSHGDDDGAYVAVWVWVDRSDVPLCACGARNDDGEGFNGMCGSCADKAEEAEESGTTPE
jgi:hypothetical protein